MKRCLLLVLAVGLVASSQANLVSNGGFESGDLTDWWTYPYDASQSVTVQSVTVADGSFSAEMVSGSDTDWQELGTNAMACDSETTYTLNLDYNKIDWAGAGIYITYWDSGWTVLDGDWFDITFTSEEGTGTWTPFSTDFTTVADTAHMEVKVSMGGWGTMYVDNVSVVPEPATLGLIGLGGLLLAGRRRK